MIWVKIKGFDYEVSNCGLVRNKYKKVLLPEIRGSRGGDYPSVTLWKNGIPKKMYVHRLAAKAFLENRESLPEVNHKDLNRHNSHISNLEWCDKKYNMNNRSCCRRDNP